MADDNQRRTIRVSIPEEVIIDEILPRLPVKSLMRFKSVCKSWQDIISGSRLITSHLQHSRQQLRVIALPSDQLGSGVVSCHFVDPPRRCQPEFQNVPTIEDVACTSTTTSHCDGLILLFSAAKLYVCNPATRKLVKLPTSRNVNNLSRIQARRMPYHAVGLGLDLLTNKYKVVRSFYRSVNLQSRTCSLGVEVLTLGSSALCWVLMQQDPPYPIWHCSNSSTSKGVMYWLIDNTLHTAPPQAIISFDLRDGKFGVIPPPPTWSKNLNDFRNEATLNVVDGDLCCIHSCGPVRHLCLYRHGSWEVKCSQQLGLNTQLLRASLPLGTCYDGKILLNIDNFFQYYDPQTETTEVIDGSPAISKQWFHTIPYVESMIPIREKHHEMKEAASNATL